MQTRPGPARAYLYLVRLGVPPVQLPSGVVDGQPVGPAQRRVEQHQTLRPVQVGSLYLGSLAPVRPVHEARGTQRKSG